MIGREMLLRHDGVIAANTARSITASWSDRLIAAVALLILLAAVHTTLLGRRPEIVIVMLALAGGIAGVVTGAASRRRLAYHASDGVLAAAALERGSRRRYRMAVHALIAGTIVIPALLVRIDAAAAALGAYGIGAAVGDLVGLAVEDRARSRRPSLSRSMRTLLKRPIAGAVAATPILLAAALFRSASPAALLAFVAALALAAGLTLTALDHAAVRFLTFSGYPARRIIAREGGSTIAMMALAVPACFARSATAAAAVAAVGTATLMLMTARILAYRIHGRRTADTLVAICGAVTAVTAVMAPVLLPAVLAAILLHLWRRSASRTWLLP